ncbi:MAG: hypothetical protein Q8L84_15445 [Hyphomonas sp.]|nr:hypothetical protein [Hyphomonas sp.]
MRFIYNDDQLELCGKSLPPFALAAAPGDLLHIGSSPMDGIAFVADVRIPARRRAQRGSRDFYRGLLTYTSSPPRGSWMFNRRPGPIN